MGMFDFLKKRTPNYKFEERDREIALERRRNNAELERLKQENTLAEERERHQIRMNELRLQKMQQEEELAEYYDDEDNLNPEIPGVSEEGKIFLELLSAIKAKQPTTAPQTPPVTTSAVVGSYSDEYLKEMWAKIPEQYKTLAKQCNDEQVCEFIKVKLIPDADPDTLRRALQIVRQS